MFSDYFVRLPYPQLRLKKAAFIRLGLNPEVYVDNIALGRLSPRAIDRAVSLLGFFPAHTLHAPFMDIMPGALDPDIRKLSLLKMEKIVDIAAAWGSRLLVSHFNYDPVYYRDHVEKWLERTAQFYRQLLRRNRRLLIALENIAEPTPDIARRLMERIGHRRAVHCFDFGHHHVFGSLPFREWLNSLGPQPYIHFHLHDNNGHTDDHRPLGRGSIDWQLVRQTIAHLGIPFSLTLEPHTANDLLETVAFYKKNFLRNSSARPEADRA